MIETMTEKEIENCSPVVLAYVGDAVFELLTRIYIMQGPRKKIRDIHHETVQIVQAVSQAEFLHRIHELLTEREQAIVRWGRNAKNITPKSASVAQYKQSTGFEALFGYLYLQGNESRLKELFKAGIEASKQE